MSTERLLVKEAFGDYAPGDRITDARTMKRVVASHPEYVLRESIEDEPAADADAPPAPDARVPGPGDEAPAKTSSRRLGRVTRHSVND